MPPTQFYILLSIFITLPVLLTTVSLFTSIVVGTEPAGGAPVHSHPSRLRAFFSFAAPSSLFPPSAFISLTDDNSTFFLARPAAFGPALPANGISGQLWAGRGFGDAPLVADTAVGGFELGCSDVPGWSADYKQRQHSRVVDAEHARTKPRGRFQGRLRQSRSVPSVQQGEIHQNVRDTEPKIDGTDDHLHHPLADSSPASLELPGEPANANLDKTRPQTHADIETLQESADIAGKIVMLSRGGCGFLEKVKWAQRRGGVALIVGDNQPGGPLTIMYAKGDTSNVTIPALFTSYNAAHLLSSLVPTEENENHSKQNNVTSEEHVDENLLAGNTQSYSQRVTLSGRLLGWVQKLFLKMRNWYEGTIPGAPVRFNRGSNDSSTPQTEISVPSISTTHGRIADGGISTTGASKNRKQGTHQSGLQTDQDEPKTDSVDDELTARVSESSPRRGSGHKLAQHKGLWVTLTPTAVSANPFFDTLLVLVISPLVTLTIVYGMLLIRSRIRRRRWRAPKSIVEQLPVRVYRTMTSSSSTASSVSGLAEDSSTNPRGFRPHATPSQSQTRSTPVTRDAISRKAKKITKPRKLYTGKQIECVVCLEEYVDGESRVMGLPCGHEFHAECITPWLVTRRRTCPICKGDVVKSFSRAAIEDGDSSSLDDAEQEGERGEGQRAETADEIQDQAVTTVNEDASAAIPIPTRDHGLPDRDIEQGVSDESTPLLGCSSQTPDRDRDVGPGLGPSRGSAWRDVVSASINRLSGDTLWRSTPNDQSR